MTLNGGCGVMTHTNAHNTQYILLVKSSISCSLSLSLCVYISGSHHRISKDATRPFSSHKSTRVYGLTDTIKSCIILCCSPALQVFGLCAAQPFTPAAIFPTFAFGITRLTICLFVFPFSISPFCAQEKTPPCPCESGEVVRSNHPVLRSPEARFRACPPPVELAQTGSLSRKYTNCEKANRCVGGRGWRLTGGWSTVGVSKKNMGCFILKPFDKNTTGYELCLFDESTSGRDARLFFPLHFRAAKV